MNTQLTENGAPTILSICWYVNVSVCHMLKGLSLAGQRPLDNLPDYSVFSVHKIESFRNSEDSSADNSSGCGLNNDIN